MITQGIQAFANKRVLLLQGPVGPFFRRLSAALRDVGATVFKVNFNAGDWAFYPFGAINYRATMQEWPNRFRDLVAEYRIDSVLLFGDCRPIHVAAHKVARELGLEIGVFEEGYVRPDFVTLERDGVNANSNLARTHELLTQPPPPIKEAATVGRTYWPMVWQGFRYFLFGALGKPLFPHYEHHRPLTLAEGFPWLRSVFRKQWYRFKERHEQNELCGRYSGRFFLVPLQVHNDAQIHVHAQLDDVAQFVCATLNSFAARAPADTVIAFKHHPMDRGYTDYGALIRRLARELGLGARVRYIHDQHLPTLMDHARGVVVVNSTVGLSAVYHGVSTKTYGSALYDLPGLTFQGPLDEFWRCAPAAQPDPQLCDSFHRHLVARSQLNGSFYKPLRNSRAVAGLIWAPQPAVAPIAKTRSGSIEHCVARGDVPICVELVK